MITHNVTKRRYIGKTNNFEWRIYQHLTALRSHRHYNEDMQRDFNLYGENYTIEIVDTVNSYQERMKEYQAMDKYQSYVRGLGYNYNDNHVSKRKKEAKNVQ